MSTDKDMYPERENVLISEGGALTPLHYDSIKVGNLYAIPLVSGAYTIYKKSNLFDDEMIVRVKTKEAVLEALKTYE
jgi:hypothetical protein